MNIFNKASRGIIYDASNLVDVALMNSANEYEIACHQLDLTDPSYKDKLNALKKKEADKRFQIQWDAGGGLKGFLARKLILVAICAIAYFFLK